MENPMTLREIQNKLLQWEAADKPLAPLDKAQKEAILELEDLLVNANSLNDKEDANVINKLNKSLDSNEIFQVPCIESTYQFLDWYETLTQSNIKIEDEPYENLLKHLQERENDTDNLLSQIKATMDNLETLSEQYNFVSTKTTTLHVMSEQLFADQEKLRSIADQIKSSLHYFTQVDQLSQRLNSPTMSVNSEQFFNVLAKIDDCLDYMRDHPSYREANVYAVKYRHLQNRAIALINSYVTHVLNNTTEQVLSPKEDDPEGTEAMDTAYAVYFGKFQAAAPRLKHVFEQIELRAEKYSEYEGLLSEVQREYSSRRQRVAGGAAAAALRQAARQHARDHCSLLRAACSLLAHACRDECALYQHFFSKPSLPLEEYLQSLCNGLYETMRPYIIHINHLETLAELCSILKIEVLEEQVSNEPWALGALGAAARALLQDTQERLVFRAHVHLRADVLHYAPAPHDLAYPDKLLMMEQIALSLQEPSLKRSDSRNSMVSDASATSQEVANINVEAQRRPLASPADLHGMWYPGVRRTLAALSRMYRCLERKVFQGLAQEAISLCVTSVTNAANQIAQRSTNIDGELFKIKHLLILREQIAPFQVDFIIKETSLDFSNVKNAAYGIIHRPRQIFSLSSNNALLEFLLEGTPTVKEHLLDSRKEVDRQLKSCCESFIKHVTEILVGPLIAFLEKAQTVTVEELGAQPWASPEQMGAVVKESLRNIKASLAPVQRSMQLYLANRETEFILFRPIRNNVVGYFMQLEQLMAGASYSSDATLIVGCPTAEQVSVQISAASLVSQAEPVQPYGKSKRKLSTSVKPTTSTVPEERDENRSIMFV